MKIINHHFPDKLVLFLFGESGVGKNYVGDVIANYNNWHVYHADQDITDEMKLALKEQRPFSDEMRDNYFALLVNKINELTKLHPQLVVTQGAYKRKHREFLQTHIANLSLVQVICSEHLLAQRIAQRTSGINVKSAQALKNDFQAAQAGELVLTNNDGADSIIEQFTKLFLK